MPRILLPVLLLSACSTGVLPGDPVGDDDAADDDDAVPSPCGDRPVCYEAAFDGETRLFEPILTDDVVQWFGYDEATASGSHGLDRSDSLVVALAQEPDDALFLVVVADAPQDGSGGLLDLRVTGHGGAAFSVVDDPGEAWTEDGTARLAFRWQGCCSDGAVLGPLPSAFCLELSVDDAEGLAGGLVLRDGPTPTPLGELGPALSLCELR